MQLVHPQKWLMPRYNLWVQLHPSMYPVYLRKILYIIGFLDDYSQEYKTRKYEILSLSVPNMWRYLSTKLDNLPTIRENRLSKYYLSDMVAANAGNKAIIRPL